MEIKTFHGGVHPAEHKELSKESPLTQLLPKGELVYMTNQHIGKPASPVVKKGDHVLAGQIIAEAGGFVSANIVSSVSGTVKAVEPRKNASGGSAMAIVVENDGEYTLAEGVGVECDTNGLTGQEILSKVQKAGIVGMGGAGFPTHVKLTVKTPEKIDYVIANGAECEPYITCDDQLMRTKAAEIVEGMEYMLRLFPNAKGVVVVENNKPEAIAAMEQACQGHDRVYVQPVKTKYPQGGERSLITVITGKHLKLGMLPADAGCVVDNVATIYAIYRAVKFNEPLMERGFTVSGDAVQNPGNFIVKIGTSHQELVDACPQAAQRSIRVQDVWDAEVHDVNVRVFQHFVQLGIHKSLALTKLRRPFPAAGADGSHPISRRLDGMIIDMAQPVGTHDRITKHSCSPSVF